MAKTKKSAKKTGGAVEASPVTIRMPEIRSMRLGDLKPDPKNPREIDDESLAGLSASLRRYGLVDIPQWNKRTGFLVGGHQRVRVLREQGLNDDSVVPVIVVDVSPKDAPALNITLNNPHIQGRFTDDVSRLLQQAQGVAPEPFAELRLDVLLAQVAPKTPQAPESFQSFGRDVQVQYECPACHYAWSGKPS